MTLVEIISALLGLSCVFLAGRNSKYNFYAGYAYNVFLFALFWSSHLWSAMILQPVSFGINAFGHYRWTHPAPEERSASDGSRLKVGRIRLGQWPGFILLLCVCASCWAVFLERHTSDPMPWLDSYILMATLFAQYLSARKYWECWIVWLAVNVANMVLYISSGLYVMPVVSALYIANGIWSLISWKKLFNKNE